MVPLGLFPVVVAMVRVILIQMNTGESLGAALVPDAKHGADSDQQESLHSDGREKRELNCQKGYYPHPNGTHCCLKCHKGTYVAQHCLGPEKTTNCSECPKDTFMPQENFYPQCRQCGNCRTTFGQISLSRCIPERDTVCGCGSHQYQTTGNSEFFCKNCSTCENGRIRQPCAKMSDTICECHPGFFLRRGENNCSPCSSCNDQDCKKHCEPMTGQVKTPSSSIEITIALGSLVFLFGTGCVALLLAKKVNFQSCQKNPTSCSYSSDREITKEPTLKFKSKTQQELQNSKVKKNDFSHTKNDDKINYSLLCRVDEVQHPSQTRPTAPLPDCVRSAGETQIPDRPKVLYTVVDHVPITRWKEFMRYLGLNENAIERICMEQRHMREAQYEMLRHWRLESGHGASVERISSVLNQMNLNGCSEAIQEALTKQP